MEFAQILKQKRKEMNLSQAELANKIFVSRSAIAKWENGLGLPSEESIEQLLKFFQVDRDFFFPPIEPEVIVAKNKKIKVWSIVSYILGCSFIIVLIIFLISLTNDSFGFFSFSLRDNSHEGYQQIVPGYYVSIKEEYMYKTVEEGKEQIQIGMNPSKDSLWKQKYISSISIYPRFGFIYSEKQELNILYCYDKANKDINYGALSYFKDIRNIYHYYYRRFTYRQISELVFNEYPNTIAMDGKLLDLDYGYHFTSNELLNSETNIQILGYDVSLSDEEPKSMFTVFK